MLGAESNASPELATRVNIVGTANVLEAARLAGLERVLLASSIAVYGSDDRYPLAALPLREDLPLYVAEGLPIYGGGKVYLEHLNTGGDTCTVRELVETVRRLLINVARAGLGPIAWSRP